MDKLHIVDCVIRSLIKTITGLQIGGRSHLQILLLPSIRSWWVFNKVVKRFWALVLRLHCNLYSHITDSLIWVKICHWKPIMFHEFNYVWISPLTQKVFSWRGDPCNEIVYPPLKLCGLWQYVPPSTCQLAQSLIWPSRNIHHRWASLIWCPGTSFCNQVTISIMIGWHCLPVGVLGFVKGIILPHQKTLSANNILSLQLVRKRKKSCCLQTDTHLTIPWALSL